MPAPRWRQGQQGRVLALGSSSCLSQVIENCPVTGIHVRTDDFGVRRVAAVETAHGSIQTPCVVNCAGRTQRGFPRVGRTGVRAGVPGVGRAGVRDGGPQGGPCRDVRSLLGQRFPGPTWRQPPAAAETS